jgi:hypothetical protein
MYGSGNVTAAALICRDGQKAWQDVGGVMPRPRWSGGSVLSGLLIFLVTAALAGWVGYEFGKERVRLEIRQGLAAVFKPKPKAAAPEAKPERPMAEVLSAGIQQIKDSSWAAKVQSRVSSDVTSEYDKFKKNTTYSIKTAYQLSSEVALEGYVVSSMEDAEPEIFMRVRRKDEDWQWLKYHDTHIKLDEEIWSDTSRLYTDTIGGGIVMETKMLSLTLEQALKLTTAKEVAVQIGSTELDISADARLAVLAPLMQWLQDMQAKVPAQ